ncbi:hypothetical protein BT93_J1407 [Corymbia citriodora subsp. variegata]|nr:hypothetical protein BT93_J1407 [Corymbia citriodora subsp. variegata]
MGFPSNVYLCSALVNMYGKCGRVSHAHDLFEELGERSAVTWNSLISGYLHIGRPLVAVDLFLKMLEAGIAPTPHSGSAALVACAQLEDGVIGRQMHALGLKAGFGCNVVFGTGLIDMYSKCSNLEDSRSVFNGMACRNDVTWTTMIAGHAQSEQPSEAMILLREMMRRGLRPNYVTYNSVLCSFSSRDYLNWCKQVHCRVIVAGLESNMYIAVTLVTVYSECGSSLEDFRKVCLGIRIWDQISWNAVIAGYANLDDGKEAVNCFCKMREAGICMDFFTFASTLKAVGSFSALKEGKQIHALILKFGHASHIYVQNGLVSMYARCGILGDAGRVFSSMEERDVISWNALLSGYAHHGFGREAVELFEQMRRYDIKPDSTTFLAVLTACSHVGLVEKGLEYFSVMRSSDSLQPPKLEHYATVVNLFGRAGHLEEAEAFIYGMPVKPGPSVYKALLSSCRIHGNKEIALRSAKKLLKLYPDDPATYVLLSNVLLTGCEWIDGAEIRALMCDRRVQKKPGSSWLEF